MCMSYKSTRRQWVKLWVNEWLDGTTRFELTAAQRLLWVDLLALAGRSRFPGFIYAGTGQGNDRVGYPIAYLAGVLQMDETDTNNALKLLAAHGHITLDEVSSEKYVIGIVNWEKYQSEYLRQKTYRKVTTETTSRLPVEEEGEVDGEGDKTFCAWWSTYPRKVGKEKAKICWQKLNEEEKSAATKGLRMWLRAEQWNREDGKFIPYASTFLAQKRYLDEAWAGCFDEPKPEPQKISDTEPLTPKLQAVRDRIFAREQGNKR